MNPEFGELYDSMETPKHLDYKLQITDGKDAIDFPTDCTLTVEEAVSKNGSFGLILLAETESNIVDYYNTIRTVKSAFNENSDKRISIYDCLDKFLNKEQLNESNLWKCSKCDQQVKAIKSTTLCKLPSILIIHLKRFKENNIKKNDFIEYPIEVLDMQRYINIEYAKYSLFAVTEHFGEVGYGHYKAVCKH